MKKIKFYIIIILMLICMPLFSAGTISGGLYAGYQYDVGNLSDKPLDADLQQNIAGGFMIKVDLAMLFFRTGAGFSYPFEKGRILNGSGGNVTGTGVSFAEVPVYAGLNFPVRDYGLFYMGAGGSYIFGFGSVETVTRHVNISEQLFGWGFIAGIESEINADLSLFFEWEYVTVSSSPMTSTGAGAYDDYYIDYTGSRYRLGIMYHFNRY